MPNEESESDSDITFEMCLGYNRFGLVGNRDFEAEELREALPYLTKRVKDELREDLLEPQVIDSWRADDARLTTELRRRVEAMRSETASLSDSGREEEPDPGLLGEVSLGTLRAVDARYGPLIDRMNKRLEGLGRDLEADKLVWAGCRTCGGVWKGTLSFSVLERYPAEGASQARREEPLACRVSVPSLDDRVVTVPVVVNVTFSCVDGVDYRTLFGHAMDDLTPDPA